MRLDQTIAYMATRLADTGIDTARLDARLLAGHALGMSDTDIILHFDRVVLQDEKEALERLLARRLKREPVAHILGVQEFWGLPFRVTPDVLVPRSDSETLVEGVLDCLKDRSQPLTLVDIGTGSGCLLLSLLHELPQAFGVGLDISGRALRVARQNANILALDTRCSFACSNYADALDGGMDILISNPPYLAEREMADLEEDVARYDPRGALVSGESGLEAYRAIFDTVASWDRRPTIMAFEFGYLQAEDVFELAKVTGLAVEGTARTHLLQDLGGRNRVLLLEQIV